MPKNKRLHKQEMQVAIMLTIEYIGFNGKAELGDCARMMQQLSGHSSHTKFYTVLEVLEALEMIEGANDSKSPRFVRLTSYGKRMLALWQS